MEAFRIEGMSGVNNNVGEVSRNVYYCLIFNRQEEK